jgi:hypothetical protein
MDKLSCVSLALQRIERFAGERMISPNHPSKM